MTTRTAPRGQPQKYPWQRWISPSLIDGTVKSKKLTLTRGKDFHCQAHGLAQMIRNRISRRGWPLAVSIQISDPKVVVTLTRI